MTREQLENLKEGDWLHSDIAEYQFNKMVGDKVFIEFIRGNRLCIDDYSISYILENFVIGRNSNKAKTYNPKHDENCIVLTKEGFATMCKAYECKGKIYAIPMKDGEPDGIFSPNQIEKFYKL